MTMDQYHPINYKLCSNEVISNVKSYSSHNAQLPGRHDTINTDCSVTYHAELPTAFKSKLTVGHPVIKPLPRSPKPRHHDIEPQGNYHRFQPFETSDSMGNHHGRLTIDGETYDVPKVKRLVAKLKSEVQQLKVSIKFELYHKHINSQALANSQYKEIKLLLALRGSNFS